MIRTQSIPHSTAKTLAVLGGQPAFDSPLHVGRPNIGDRELFLSHVNTLLDNHWLTNNGPMVVRLENELSDLLGVKHCLAICNATIALEIVAQALGLTGEVIVPSFTFVATAHALQWLGITPVFCDIDPLTHNLDPTRVEELITPRTTGILSVHVWGRPCAVEALQTIADDHDLKLVFDAAHALGCSYRGKMIGGFGDAEVFSLHATKFFNSFEGGIIATNNDGLARKIRHMRNFGFENYDEVVSVGTNGKMSEVSAAMGLTSLASMERFVAANRRNYYAYQRELETIPGLTLAGFDDDERCNYQYIVVDVDPEITGLSRDDLVRVFHAENVLARRYFWPGCHRMEPYKSASPDVGLRLPETERLSTRIMALPNGTAIDVPTISAIGDILRTAISHADAIREKAPFQR